MRPFSFHNKVNNSAIIKMKLVHLLAFSPTRFVPPTMQYSVDSTRGLNLPAPQQKAFVEAFKTAEFSVAALSGTTFDEKVAIDPEKFDALRAAYPDLAPLTDAKITAVINSYVATKVTPVEAFFGTPVGPVILLNLMLWASGLSACDLPFVDASSKACLELASRRSGDTSPANVASAKARASALAATELQRLESVRRDEEMLTTTWPWGYS